MTQQRQHKDYLRALLDTAYRRPGLWCIPLFSAVLIALLIAFLGPKTWDASQAFIVREEFIGRTVRPGRFDSLDTMKTAQEVIQEVARRPRVIKRVMLAVDGEEPSRKEIQELQEAISFSAPGGSELGNTEILTMRVKASTTDKARQLVEALFDETRNEIRRLRQERAASMMQEIGESVELAKGELLQTSAMLKEIESKVGGDLAELRVINGQNFAGSDLRRTIAQIEAEKRQAESQEAQTIQLISHLEAASRNPSALLATPRELLESQPALEQLKIQLIEAQVSRATVGGLYSMKHPRFQSSNKSVRDIRYQINLELETALAGLETQRSLANRSANLLGQRSEEIEKRITDLALVRVEYGQLNEELRVRNEAISKAQAELAQASSMHRAAQKVDFMTKLDEAQTGLRPLGPTKRTMLFAAAVAGGLFGLGLVMMVTPVPSLPFGTDSGSSGSTPLTRQPQPAPQPNSATANTTKSETAQQDTSPIPTSSETLPSIPAVTDTHPMDNANHPSTATPVQTPAPPALDELIPGVKGFSIPTVNVEPFTDSQSPQDS